MQILLEYTEREEQTKDLNLLHADYDVRAASGRLMEVAVGM